MTSPPLGDDVELYVFGPGYGEGLLVYLGCDEWMVVDSCVDTSGQPVALKWLERIGVDPKDAVTLVVATHWHDDHVRGLAQTFHACSNAQFVCSAAVLSNELLRLAYDANDANIQGSSGLDELRRVVDELCERRRSRSNRTLSLGHELATANKRIYQRRGDPHCEVWSLSPSSSELQTALNLMVDEYRQQSEAAQARRRIVARAPNHTSVALLVCVGSRRLLLGADLEEQGTISDTGWTAVVSSSERPQERSSVIKVPHHGSITAHHDGMWDAMLVPSPWAVLTPFERGRISLPTHEDCGRILERTSNAYISTRGPSRRYKPSQKVVSWAMEGKRPRTRTEPGHVMLRAKADDPSQNWDVTLIDGACALGEYVTTTQRA